jgi:membrane AbrB-like protein
LLVLTLFLLASGVGVGYLYSRVAKTDLLTGLLATTPGNIGVMASIAADYGRNPSIVSMVQLMRFTAITFIIPLISDVSRKTDAGAALQALNPDIFNLQPVYLMWLGSLLTVATIAVRLGTRLKVPVAGLLCAIAVGTVFNALFNLLPWFPTVDFSLPPLLNLVGQILLGLTIGEYWGISPRLRKGAIAHALIPVLLTFMTGLMAAGLAMTLTSWDWLTCLLVTAPGGSPEMIWIALGLNRNVEIVTAGHLVRLIAINLSLPILVSLAGFLDHRIAQGSKTSLVEG